MDKEKYLQKLESEHTDIQRLFAELAPVIELGKLNGIKSLKEKLDALKTMLVAHVKSEDEIFYAELQKKAVQMKQEALIPALELFMHSMRDISKDAVSFFNTYRTDGDILDNLEDFRNELKELRDNILKRIRSEEGSLFYIYRAYFLD